MNVKADLVSQYRAGLAMLRDCLTQCPDDLWSAGAHPRTTWRIAYHALFYTHFYLMPDCDSFVPTEIFVWHGRILWEDDEAGMPPEETTYSQADLIGYLDFIDAHIPEWVENLDLASPTSGFPWYPISKLAHQFVNLRHLSGHTGQIQELLYARGLSPRWVGRG